VSGVAPSTLSEGRCTTNGMERSWTMVTRLPSSVADILVQAAIPSLSERIYLIALVLGGSFKNAPDTVLTTGKNSDFPAGKVSHQKEQAAAIS